MGAAVDIIRDPESAAGVLSPVRQRILGALGTPDSSTGVARSIGLPRQRVNYHVRELERLGLVEHVADRRKGNCTERVVRATATRYLIAPSVMGALEARPEDEADSTSSAHLAAVAARTVSEVAELRERAAAAGKRLATFSLEAAVRFASPADQAAFVAELARTLNALVARYHAAQQPGGRWFRVLAGAHPALPADSGPDAAPARASDPGSPEPPSKEGEA